MDNATAAPRSAPPDTSAESTTAASTPTAPTSPDRPTTADVALLSFAQQYELTIRDLYEAALSAGVAEGEYGGVFTTLREDHEEYANAISALLGVAAPQRRDDALYDELLSQFDTDDTAALAAAAYDLESQAVATHVDLIGQLQGVLGAKAIGSFLIVEAQHCTVLADIAGNGDDLTALLDNSATSAAPAAAPTASEPTASEPVETAPASSTATASSAPVSSAPGTSEPASVAETTEG